MINFHYNIIAVFILSYMDKIIRNKTRDKNMETLAVILMIALFVLVLVFIFSTALLTPLIGKKNLIFVILLGFTVGAVGGAFFIAPVFDVFQRWRDRSTRLQPQAQM